MLAVSLGNWELGNSGSRKEPFLPENVLRRLKTARRFERGDRLLQVAKVLPASNCIKEVENSTGV